MTVSPPVIGQAGRKVASLRSSGFSEDILQLAIVSVLHQQLPLRDAIVLREAKRISGTLTADAEGAWQATRERLRFSIPESTFRLWIDPLRLAGAEGKSLLLAAPEGIRAWAERRYSSLISEALQDNTPYRRVAFVSSGEGR